MQGLLYNVKVNCVVFSTDLTTIGGTRVLHGWYGIRKKTVFPMLVLRIIKTSIMPKYLKTKFRGL